MHDPIQTTKRWMQIVKEFPAYVRHKGIVPEDNKYLKYLEILKGRKEDLTLADVWAFERKKKTKEEIRYWKNHGFSLGANKVVVVSPTYAKLDLRKNRKHKFLRSESAKGKLLKQIRRSIKLLNMELEIIDQTAVDSSEVEEFNDIIFLRIIG